MLGLVLKVVVEGTYLYMTLCYVIYLCILTYIDLMSVPDLAHLDVTIGEGGSNNCDTFISEAPPHHKQHCAHH